MQTTHDVIVIGAGAAGLAAADVLARARMRTLVVDPGTVDGQAGFPGARVLDRAEVGRLDVAGPVKSVDVGGAGTFTAPAILLATRPGLHANAAHLLGVLDQNDAGEVRTDDAHRASVPGVFAAGDARAPRHGQVAASGSDGAAAAASAVAYVEALARRVQPMADSRRFLRTPARAVTTAV